MSDKVDFPLNVKDKLTDSRRDLTLYKLWFYKRDGGLGLCSNHFFFTDINRPEETSSSMSIKGVISGLRFSTN